MDIPGKNGFCSSHPTRKVSYRDIRNTRFARLSYHAVQHTAYSHIIDIMAPKPTHRSFLTVSAQGTINDFRV